MPIFTNIRGFVSIVSGLHSFMEKFLYSIVGLKKPLEELDVKQALVALSIVYLTLHWSYVQKFTDTETKEYVYNCVLWILSILAFATKVYHIFQNGQ